MLERFMQWYIAIWTQWTRMSSEQGSESSVVMCVYIHMYIQYLSGVVDVASV